MLDLTPDELVDNEVIITLLSNVSSEELIKLYCSINHSLVNFDFHNHMEVLDLLSITSEASEVDPLDIPLEVDDVIREACRITINECGVHYDDDIPLELLSILLDTIVGFDVTDSPQDLIDRLEVAEDDLDCVLLVLSDSSGYDYEDWMTHIERVEFGVMERMLFLCNEALNETLDEGVFTPPTLDRLDKTTLIKSVLPNALEGDVQVSMESLFVNNLSHLEELDVEESVRHLWVYGCLSNEGIASADRCVSDYINMLYFEPTIQEKALKIKNEIRPEFTAFFGG